MKKSSKELDLTGAELIVRETLEVHVSSVWAFEYSIIKPFESWKNTRCLENAQQLGQLLLDVEPTMIG